jgi:hypothetical protein
MKITLPNYKPMSIIELYEAAATEMGCENTSEIKYDCTKINVAENIQDGFYEYYLALVRENDTYSHENEAMADITLVLAMSGPKVDKALKANEVEVFDGFTIQN